MGEMNVTLVSIIVPCYNQAQFLPETLDSVLAQTYQNWECILVNDGSTDNTETIAKSYCKKDYRFKYLFKANGGLSSARNAGINEAKGEYLQFLDSDDLILPEKLATQVSFLNGNPTSDICLSRYKLFSNNRNNTFDTPLSVLPYNCSLNGFLFSWNVDFVFPPVSYLIKAEFLQHNKIRFNEGIKAWEDWLFLVQVTIAGAKFGVTEDYLSLYRRHEGNMTNDVPFMTQNMVKATFLVYESLPIDLKPEFVNSINVFLLQSTKGFLNVNQLTEKANSLEYKIGNTILKPFYKVKVFKNRVVRKISKMIRKK